MESVKIYSSQPYKLVRHQRVLEHDIGYLCVLFLLAGLLVPHDMARLYLAIACKMFLE